jgi:hypothetical protein
MFKAPLDEKMPGLYALLQVLGNSIVKDLVVLLKRQTDPGKQGSKESKDEQPVVKEGLDEESQNMGKGAKRRKSVLVPRITSDKLIEKTGQTRGVTPRRVSLHRTDLRGAQNYREAVRYFQAIASNPSSSDEDREFAADYLGLSRQSSYKVSVEKAAKVPEQFSLETIADPITDEPRTIQSWVIEHSNPKREPGESGSMLELYRKYYKSSSALAFLDEMKPWFIGE